METKFKETEIGRIPVEWTIKPLSKLVGSDKLDFIDGDWIESPYITSEGIRLIQTGNIGRGSFLDTTRRYVSEQTFVELKCKEVYSGDMLICRLAAPIGRACIVPDTGEKYITAVDCTIVRPDSTIVDKYYLNHFINWRRTLNLMERYGGGVTHQRISRKNLSKIPIPLPPLPKQRKIAEILSTVDETIEGTDAIIEETQQLKKGLMQKLFTEGIGHTQFKETAIGRIPEEWEVVNLSNVFQVIDGDRGVNYPKSNEMFDEGYCVFLNAKNVTKSGFKFDEVQFITQEKDEILGKGKLTRGDLVLTTRGTLGNFAFFNDEVTFENLRINSGMVVLRPLNNILTNYYYKYFNSYLMQNQIERLSFGTAQSQLTVGGIQKFRLLVPPNDEQCQIAQILSEVDSRIEKEQVFKEELEQLKKGLMQVLLTGKIRVKV